MKEVKPSSDRLREIRESVNKELKHPALLFGSDSSLQLDLIKLGIPPLDDMLGGGLARGRFYLVIGRYAVGKTYLTQMAIKGAQAVGLTAAYIDAEKAYNKDWFRKVGINTDDLLVSQPGTGEVAFDIVHALVMAGVDLVVVDSLAALVPTAEAEEDMGHSTVGSQARLINQGFRKLLSINQKSVVLFTNQTRASIGPYGGETLPGGVGQQFWAWGIVRVTRGGWLTEKSPKKGDEQRRVGFEMGFRTEKNRQSIPFQGCLIPFYFKTGNLELTAALVNLAIDMRLIGGKPPYYEFKGEKFFGRAKLVTWLDAHEDIKTELWAAIHTAEEGAPVAGTAADPANGTPPEIDWSP